jgi:hypothetical protein
LLIGIDRYALLGPRYQLAGCVNDAELMQRILQDQFGFPASNITLLTDEAATRAAVLTAMDAFAARVGPDDIAVICYSGHGSQMTDREGDEPDGLDETIVPHDSGRHPHPNRDITDDEIYTWLLGLTGVTPYVTLIFDCCHSGTITRDAFGTNARWVEPDTRPVADLPPSPVAQAHAREAGRDLGASGWLPLGERYVLIAGCRDEESSYEHRVSEGGSLVTHGALTYYLSRELVTATDGTTYRDVFERAGSQVTAAHPRQHPQMEGAGDRVLFDVTSIEPMRFLPVRRRAAEQVTLGGGAAHGITVGSRWAVYPQGTKQITDETLRLGLVEIAQINAVTCDARILDEREADRVAPADRAVERDHAYGEMRLVVEVQASTPYEESSAQLMELINASALLRLAEPGEPAEARATLIAPRTGAELDDPVPQLAPVVVPTWAVVGADGRLMMPVHATDEIGVATLLRDNLEKAARYRHALALRNADPHSPLRGKVDFILKRLSDDGTWERAEPQLDGGMIVFEEGDRLAAEIVSHYTAPIYVSVLDFGLTGAVGLLHPVAGASEQLAPSRSIHIGMREGDEVNLYMPEDFPYAPDPEDDHGVLGSTETLKLLATTHEADFSLLVQPGYRDLGARSFPGASTPLGQLLDMALTGQGIRDLRRNRVSPDQAWTTVERSFFLQRRTL